MTQFTTEIRELISYIEHVGLEIMKIYETDFSHELKGDDSPLTQADMLSHNLITKYLKEHFEDYGVLSEESENENGLDEKEFIWVIDPLDGTKDFIHKTDEFSIMVGLLNGDRESVLGIVHVPAQHTTYVGIKDEGSYKIQNGVSTRITVNTISQFFDTTLVRSRNHFSTFDEEVCEKLGIKEFIKCGSCGVKFGRIAEGNAELCYYTTSHLGVWDSCAAEIILKEAGGEVFDKFGNEIVYDIVGRKMRNGFIGTNGNLSKETVSDVIQEILREKEN